MQCHLGCPQESRSSSGDLHGPRQHPCFSVHIPPAHKEWPRTRWAPGKTLPPSPLAQLAPTHDHDATHVISLSPTASTPMSSPGSPAHSHPLDSSSLGLQMERPLPYFIFLHSPHPHYETLFYLLICPRSASHVMKGSSMGAGMSLPSPQYLDGSQYIGERQHTVVRQITQRMNGEQPQ